MSGEDGAHAANLAALGRPLELVELSGMQNEAVVPAQLSEVSSGVDQQEIADRNTLIGKKPKLICILLLRELHFDHGVYVMNVWCS